MDTTTVAPGVPPHGCLPVRAHGAETRVPLRVGLYRDPLWPFKSGIDTAYRHQLAALAAVGVPTSTTWDMAASVVHFNWYSPAAFWQIQCARTLGQRIVVIAHSAHDMRGSFNYPEFMEPLMMGWLGQVYRQADLVITPSNYCRRLIREPEYAVTGDVLVISNGVDRARFTYRAQGAEAFRRAQGIDGPLVLSVGQFIPRKGVVDFIETARRMPEATFVWCGPNHNWRYTATPAMRDAVDSRTPNVRLLGFVDDLVAAMSAADVFFMPSFEENQGIVLLEASAVGRSIVARPLPAYTDAFVDGVHYLTADDAAGFVTRIRALIEQPDLRTNLGQAAFEMAIGHDLAHIGQRLVRAYVEYFDLATD